MTPRPCTWPDGGCGEPIIDVTTAAGRKQVLDAKPVKGIVLMHERGDPCPMKPGDCGGAHRTKVVEVYQDHHSTCATWLARVERALPDGPRRMLDELLAAHPAALARDELARRAGFSPTSSSVGVHLKVLRDNNLAEVDAGEVRASPTLFLEGPV